MRPNCKAFWFVVSDIHLRVSKQRINQNRPFFSSGGSSIIITLCMCGFVVNASRCNSENEYVKSMNESFIKVDSISGVDVYE